MVYVVKKDHTKEEFNVNKVIAAVNKSAIVCCMNLQRGNKQHL